MRHTPLTTAAILTLSAACSPADSGSSDTPPTETLDAVVATLPEGAEAISLLGEPLHPIPAPAEVAARQAEDIEAARADYESDPDDADAIIWLGRRIGYTGRYRDAIEVFSEGIFKHLDDARMYRHRGHRWISVREFDRAIEDLSHAAAARSGRTGRGGTRRPAERARHPDEHAAVEHPLPPRPRPLPEGRLRNRPASRTKTISR